VQSVYGDECIDVSIVGHGVQQFKQECYSTPMVSGERKILLKDRIRNLVECWQKCIEVGGDCVEQWLCTVVNKD